jgi:hypothetical protein
MAVLPCLRLEVGLSDWFSLMLVFTRAKKKPTVKWAKRTSI